MSKTIIIKIVKFYQRYVSPLLGKNCRFYPSCSEYAFQAVEKYGTAKGIIKSTQRVLRCHPWNPGGVDIP